MVEESSLKYLPNLILTTNIICCNICNTIKKKKRLSDPITNFMLRTQKYNSLALCKCKLAELNNLKAGSKLSSFNHKKKSKTESLNCLHFDDLNAFLAISKIVNI